MAWTPRELLSDISSGPFLLGKGAAGSEASLGDIRDAKIKIWYEVEDVTAGDHFGRATILDQVVTGVRVEASFGLMQNIADADKAVLADVLPLGTLSAGPTNKTMTLDVATICGAILSASAARWIFHKKSVASLTDMSKDIVFPAAIVYPSDEDIILSGEGAIIIPCHLVAFPDANNDVIIIGKDAA